MARPDMFNCKLLGPVIKGKKAFWIADFPCWIWKTFRILLIYFLVHVEVPDGITYKGDWRVIIVNLIKIEKCPDQFICFMITIFHLFTCTFQVTDKAHNWKRLVRIIIHNFLFVLNKIFLSRVGLWQKRNVLELVRILAFLLTCTT